MSNEIIKESNSEILAWQGLSNETKWHCRVSRLYNFSTIEDEDAALTNPIFTAALTSGVGKYYWQWKGAIVTGSGSGTISYGAGDATVTDITYKTSEDWDIWAAVGGGGLTFNVVGSISGNVGIAVFGTPFVSAGINLTLNAGIYSYMEGEPLCSISAVTPQTVTWSRWQEVQSFIETA
jgi:hypothetical protein